ncbi:MAG: hypothetical protein HQL22_09450 [Candidatus Omnitrophica bacterium]|nr:hypothetical protein [Candidatus Omnitrophota bacterium]
MPHKKTILIHYAHKQTMGHTTRMLSLCQGLSKHHGPQPQIHLLEGGIPQPHAVFPASTKIHTIPQPFDSRQSFSKHRFPAFFKERAAYVLKTATTLQPDTFITEFFPFGRIEYLPEIMPTLIYLRTRGTRIYASIGYPLILNILQTRRRRILDLILQISKFYHKILIHTPPGLEDPYFINHIASTTQRDQCIQLLANLSAKIVYTGYIAPFQQERTPMRRQLIKKEPGTFTVIVSRGGGAVAPRIITTAIRAQAILGKRYRFIIACGPSTTTKEFQLFKHEINKLTQPEITLIRDIPDLEYFFNHCDATISMCGYNTSVQLMRTGIPSVLLPFTTGSSQTGDQIPRAELMRDLFHATILNWSTMTPKQLARAIEKQSRQKVSSKHFPQHWFNGRKVSSDIILQS